MSDQALFISVPVDRLKIVKGPSSKKMLEACIRLNEMQLANPQSGCVERLPFTFQTPLSPLPFRRYVDIACLYSERKAASGPITRLDFTGYFYKRYIEGDYNMTTQSGELYLG